MDRYERRKKRKGSEEREEEKNERHVDREEKWKAIGKKGRQEE